MENKVVIIEVRNVYGNQNHYPVCDTGKLFLKLTGTKTLSLDQLKTIKALGYDLQVKASIINIAV